MKTLDALRKRVGLENVFLPNQKENLPYFNGSAKSAEKRIVNLIKEYSEFFFSGAVSRLDNGVAIGSHMVNLVFLEMMAMTLKPKRVLEIGTFTGLSTMAMANHSETVVTIEKFKEAAEIAEANFVQFDIKNVILHVCDAKEIVPKFVNQFDLIFIDGDKENYDFYFKEAVGLLHENGTIIVDDVFFMGDILNNVQTTEKGKGVKRMLDSLKEFKGKSSIIPIGHGMLVWRKK